MKAILRNLRITSKKVNVVADLIRRKQVDEALAILKFLPKKAALPLYKTLHSAVSNAVNNFKQKRESLVIEHIVVNEGATLKRSRPVSRGRAHPIKKRTSHIRIELMVKAPEKPAKKETGVIASEAKQSHLKAAKAVSKKSSAK